MMKSVTRDSDLARALMTGQPEAFEQFVEHYRAKVFQYSYSMCGQREDAEEVAQETLLSVFQHLGQIRDPDHLKPWVFRIAKNACLMKRRKSVFAPPAEEPLDELDAASGDPVPERVVLDAEQQHLLCGAIIQLPEIYRCVVLLRDVEELSTEETADILGVSEDVVKTRLKRARRALREQLEHASAGDWHLDGPAPLDITCKRRLMDAYSKAVNPHA
jgi:RNA polymerase sigma-70 factor (ECF subfamily)